MDQTSNVVHCKKCGLPLREIQVRAMLGNPNYTEWCREGYCSLQCFEAYQEKPTVVPESMNNNLAVSETPGTQFETILTNMSAQPSMPLKEPRGQRLMVFSFTLVIVIVLGYFQALPFALVVAVANYFFITKDFLPRFNRARQLGRHGRLTVLVLAGYVIGAIVAFNMSGYVTGGYRVAAAVGGGLGLASLIGSLYSPKQ